MSEMRRNSPPSRRIDSGENWLKSSHARRRPQLAQPHRRDMHAGRSVSAKPWWKRQLKKSVPDGVRTKLALISTLFENARRADASH